MTREDEYSCGTIQSSHSWLLTAYCTTEWVSKCRVWGDHCVLWVCPWSHRHIFLNVLFMRPSLLGSCWGVKKRTRIATIFIDKTPFKCIHQWCNKPYSTPAPPCSKENRDVSVYFPWRKSFGLSWMYLCFFIELFPVFSYQNISAVA